MPQPLRIKYTPAQIATMTDKTVRARYSKLRKAAMQRARRLQAAGFGDTDVADVSFPTIRELTPEQIREELAEASRYLRDPRTTVRGLRSYTQRAKEALEAAHYPEAAKDLKKFGDFMETLRARHIGRFYGSAQKASIYEESQRLGISGKTLIRNFKSYLEDEEKAKKLLDTLQASNLPRGRKRLSSNELKALL